MKSLSTLFVAAMVLPLVLQAADTEKAQVGKKAPDFTLNDLQGKEHQLSDYRGKIVVLESLNFGCPYVRNHYETGAMQELQKWAKKQDVVWIQVNSVAPSHPNYVTPKEAQEQKKQYDVKSTAWLQDPKGKVGRTYGMKTTPHMFIIDKDGTLVYDGAIDDRPSTRGNPRTAHNYVEAALKSLLNGESIDVQRTKPYGCSVKYGST